jgi:uncharacterized membrane protein
MRSNLGFVFVLALMVLTPLSTMFEQPIETDTNFNEIPSFLTPEMSEEERLELATEMWGSMPEASLVSVELTPATGMIHMAAGSFDPLFSEGPDVLASFSRDNDAALTGLAMVQLHDGNRDAFQALNTDYDLTVLDFFHDEGWLVRLPSPPMDTFVQLENDDRIRWIGHQQPQWRLAPDLIHDGITTPSITLIPASDLGFGGYPELATDLVRYGAEEAWCDAWLCRAVISEGDGLTLLRNIAHDGRVIWTEPSAELRVHNALAWSIAGVQDVNNNATFTLDGSGEMIAVTDTGLDQNHPDLTGRVAATYTQFGLDPSPDDTNSGHGTHIAVTVVGNGSGDSSARGVAPSANLVMYALEHDPTGVFGRIGSIYDLLRDAEQMTARIAVNAWGLNGNFGQYTADARSVDQFVNDRSDMTPIFSIGDNGGQGASQITSPATAKNTIAIGASTTGADGSVAAGEVANFSSDGPTLDGRIKPDLVAPGVGVCSGLAEEAKFPAGPSCLTGSHATGNSYYMQLSGTSQATAVASGVAALTREFIREQAGVSSPSSSLVKAAMINGAQDLGTPDIPNANEGWGQVDLSRTVLPMDGTTPLNTFFDDNKPLSPGFGLLYSFTLDPSHGIDITLAWSDEAGSANAPQNQPRLVNNMDLILVDPNGAEWIGNHFSSGSSISGGTADDINNVERVRIPAGTLPASQGQWILKVLHRGGTTQDFGLVMSAVATPTPQADLAVFDGSIVPSSVNPLRNDLIAISIAWVNQGTSQSVGFDVLFEDLTTQQTLTTASRNGLQSGQLDAITIYHQFATTGIHSLRISIDTTDQVVEMNDANAGTDNNVYTLDVEVMALGVRVVVADDNGDLPETTEERESNANMILDVRNDSGIDIPLAVLHEGTGNQSVVISSTMVQVPSPERADFFLPSQDQWSRTFDESTNFILTAQGSEDANNTLNLRLEDLDADLTTNPDSPRYVRAGTYVVDITARYEFQPTVAHSQRIYIVVEQLDQVSVVAAGTNGLEAEPGASSFFSISVKNTGNAPAQYSVECFSEHRWQVMLGGSNSSQLDFEPLNIQEYLPMAVRIIVPLVAGGVPAAGDTDTVTCYVTSFTDLTMNFTEIVSIEVLPQESFDVHLEDDDGRVGPSHLSSDNAVDSGQKLYMNLTVENTGNLAVALDVRVQPSNPLWAIRVSHDGQNDSRTLGFTIPPGQSTVVMLVFTVPITAAEGDSNTFTIRTERSSSNFRSNVTELVVRDELALSLSGPENGQLDVTISERFTYGEFSLRNTGNTALGLEWTHGLTPDGWSVGFANPVIYIEPREEKVVRLGLIPPLQAIASPSSFELLVSVNGTNAGRFTEASQMITVGVLESTYANLTVEDETIRPLEDISRDGSSSQNFILLNDGNIPFTGTIGAEMLDKNGALRNDWTITVSPESVSELAVGESVTLTVTLAPKEDVSRAIGSLSITVSSGDEVITTYALEASTQAAVGNQGLLSGLSTGVTVSLFAVVFLALAVVARRVKRSGELQDDGLELVAPDSHTNPDTMGSRRDEVLDISSAVHDLTSGEVSQEEIAKALMQSMDLPSAPAAVPSGLPPGMPRARLPPAGMPPAGMPPSGLPSPEKSLPPLPLPMQPIAPVQPTIPVAQGPPLPPNGLPPGWTMEQWTHYGHQWLQRQG